MTSSNCRTAAITDLDLLDPDGMPTKCISMGDSSSPFQAAGYRYSFAVHGGSGRLHVRFRVRCLSHDLASWCQHARVALEPLKGSQVCTIPVRGAFYPGHRYIIELESSANVFSLAMEIDVASESLGLWTSLAKAGSNAS